MNDIKFEKEIEEINIIEDNNEQQERLIEETLKKNIRLIFLQLENKMPQYLIKEIEKKLIMKNLILILLIIMKQKYHCCILRFHF